VAQFTMNPGQNQQVFLKYITLFISFSDWEYSNSDFCFIRWNWENQI
jgi:hypothetical protein